ncbi:MAG TPA: hypothetical protein DCL41_05515, partial [Bdellovibrionales bacterium]|nr:hypothetical protein [Bdellovibrionales bacterium]
WHGILLPNDQDGVPLVNSLPIESGAEKIYEFPIKQTGTYWYHSHVMFQEEDGVYGAIRILPKESPSKLPEKTILFSDLSHEKGADIHRNLKRDGDYYDIYTDTVQSWWRALKKGTVWTKFRSSLQRMGGMDYSDVAYDFFTANGQPQIHLYEQGNLPSRVKLRLINGSATSIYKVTYAGGPITVVAADGLPVEPIKVNILPMSVAETYDVLVDLKAGHQLELRATSFDNSGYSSVFLGPQNSKIVNAPKMPWEDPTGVSMGAMMGMPRMGFWQEFKMSYQNEFADLPKDLEYQFKSSQASSHTSSHKGHSMNMKKMNSHAHGMGEVDRIMNQAPETRKNNLISSTPTPIYNELTYGLLKSKTKIMRSKDETLRIIPFTLNGNMENYVWTINGRPLGPETYIKIRKGERVRFVMRNTTMMNHPMHLHGHFFRVMTRQGEWSVLKHTVNVAPMSTTTIEFEATEEKDWFFHCHILYHMMDGMTRTVRYIDTPGPEKFVEMRKNSKEFDSPSQFYFRNKLLAQSNYSRLEGKFFSSYYQMEYSGIANYDGDYEAELQLGRTLTRFFTAYIGALAEQEGKSESKASPSLGVTWLLPLRIHANLKYLPLLEERPLEFELENSIQLTDRLQSNIGYGTSGKLYSELEWRQTKHLSFTASYSHNYKSFGLGLGYTY